MATAVMDDVKVAVDIDGPAGSDEAKANVVLEMTWEQAVSLLHVMAHVGGHPVETYRGDIESIFYQLQAAGVPWMPSTAGGKQRFAGHLVGVKRG